MKSQKHSMRTNEEILKIFGENDRLENLSQRCSRNYEEGLKEIYKKLRPGEPATFESAYDLVEALFFDTKRYDLARSADINTIRSLDRPTGL